MPNEMSSSYLPRRSRRCVDCQIRKKGCDMQIPACGQCQRARINCRGYYTNLVWLESRQQQHRDWSLEKKDPLHKSLNSCMAQNNSLTRSATRQRLAGCFWSVYLPNGQQCSGSCLELCSSSWTKVAVQLEDTDEALRSIVLALGSGFVAASSKPDTPSGDLRLLNLQTIWLYHRAIWSLKESAKSPRRLYGNGILAATKLVQVFEMFFGETLRNLRADDVSRYDSIAAHYRGQIAIIAHRGPADFACGFAHDLFVDFRLYLTVSAIFVRTTLSINEGEWQKAPWSNIPKGPKDVLTDIIHEVVSLLKCLDQLRASDGDVKDQTELLYEATRVQNALRLWHSNLPREAEEFDYTRSESITIEVTCDRRLSLLYLINLYWCACMLIDTTIGFLQQIRLESSRPPSPAIRERHIESDESGCDGRSKKEMVEIGILNASRCYAYKVAHSAYLMRGSVAGISFYMMSVVPISIALSLLIASEPVDQMSLERQKLQRALEGHALRSWVLQFADATENSAARREQAKSRRLRWWTRFHE